ncbi:MAG: lipopolysaccharide biosynthesis protein [Bacteroidales bacterium]|nr:lipopolysaccharide biosynthesis protein [Bacteroidales bacterium]
MKTIDILRHSLGKDFVRNSLTLLSASTFAQIITFAVYPIITRLYSPENFGVLNLLLTIVGLLAIASTGRYESAIVMESENRNAKALLQLIFGINIIFFIVTQLIFSLFSHPIASLFESGDSLKPWLPMIPIMVLLMGLWQGLNNYFIREKRFKMIGCYSLTKSIVNSGSKIGFGLAGMLQSGLIISTLIGLFTSLAVAFSAVIKKCKDIFRFDKEEIKKMAKKYANFPKFELPQAISNSLASNLPLLLLPLCFTMDEIGLFSLALTIGFTPVFIFNGAMDQVLYKQSVDLLHNNQSIRNTIRNFCLGTTAALLPIFILFFFISEWFFGFVFGEQWVEAGLYFKILLPWLFMVTLTSSLTFIPKLFFKQKTAMMIEFTYFILRVLVLLYGICIKNFTHAIIGFGIVSTLMVSIQLIWYFSLIKRHSICHQ